MEEKQKKPFYFYSLIVIVIIIILNAVVFPLVQFQQTQEVSYDTFLRALSARSITEVQVDTNQIYYKMNGTSMVYYTVTMDDPDLVSRLMEAGVTFSRVAPQEMGLFLSILLSYGLPLIFFLLIWRLMSRRMSNMGGNFMSFGKSSARIYANDETDVTFADVAGQDEAKDSLREIVGFLHEPHRYAEIGATLPKGALLVGPPGTGKTLLARAVAGEAHVPFFSMSGSEFVEMFVGMGAAKVRDLFKQANDKAPCIVFIDEIDAIGQKRDSGIIGGNDEREQTLNQLLSEMDGFDGTRGVVILAATNRPEVLDKALLRPGRFDRRIPVELPDLAGREAVLAVHVKKIKLEETINLREIARATVGASGAELANIVNEAALRAVRLGRSLVSQEDLEESVEAILAGQQRKNAVISPREREIVAYHEVGHALVAARQMESAPVHKITIVPRTSGALGYTMQVDENEHFLMSREEVFNKIVTLTGGRTAEELIFHTMTTGASNDIEQATRLARAMITRYGMSEKFGMVALETINNPYLSADATLSCSSETAAKIDAEVVALITKAHNTAKAILEENRAKLDKIAKYLLEKETLSGEEFLALLAEESESEQEA